MKGENQKSATDITIGRTTYLGAKVWAKIESVSEPKDGRREVRFYLKCGGRERYLTVLLPARLRRFALVMGPGTFWNCSVHLVPTHQLFLAAAALRRND